MPLISFFPHNLRQLTARTPTVDGSLQPTSNQNSFDAFTRLVHAARHRLILMLVEHPGCRKSKTLEVGVSHTFAPRLAPVWLTPFSGLCYHELISEWTVRRRQMHFDLEWHIAASCLRMSTLVSLWHPWH